MYVMLNALMFSTVALSQELPKDLSPNSVDCTKLLKNIPSLTDAKRTILQEACNNFQYEMIDESEFRSIYNQSLGLGSTSVKNEKDATTVSDKDWSMAKNETNQPRTNYAAQATKDIPSYLAMGIGAAGLSCSAMTYNDWKSQGGVTEDQLGINRACVIVGAIGITSGALLMFLSKKGEQTKK
ncbi:MAG: hypothetical protein VX278_23210 [Myxococcota bacterium]|nr:hypothetical protein [Myxococcota bacterium]